MENNFAVFILSHGRPDSVLTYDSLRACGYTGRIVVLVDDLDPTVDKYREKYGDDVYVFDKQAAVDKTDACDSLRKHNSVVFARNANFAIAKELGIEYFWQLDDDYTSFGWVTNNEREYVTKGVKLKNLDAILEAYLRFYIASGAKSVGIAQGGDLIGGAEGCWVDKLCRNNTFSRKCMNSFMLSIHRPVEFRGRVNDDVNLYVECGRRGDLFITIPRLRLWQPQTQQESGGCTDVYLALGTYIKSFYSVLVAPSCVQLAMMGGKHRRIHHRVEWKYACPKVISEKYRRKSDSFEEPAKPQAKVTPKKQVRTDSSLSNLFEDMKERNDKMRGGGIVPSQSFLFVKIARTASESMHGTFHTTVRDYIRVGHLKMVADYYERAKESHSVCHNHLSVPDLLYRSLIPRQHYDRRYKFAFVRNPWDRLVSLWRLYSNKKDSARATARGCETFDEYVRKMHDQNLGQDFKPLHHKYTIAQSQWRWIPFDFDFIGAFERLSADYKFVAETLGLPLKIARHTKMHKEGGSSRRHYSEFYTPETEAMVKTIYEDDCRVFGYTGIGTDPHDSDTILKNLKEQWAKSAPAFHQLLESEPVS